MPVFHVEESRLYKFNKKINLYKQKCANLNETLYVNSSGIEYKNIENNFFKFYVYDIECKIDNSDWEFVGFIEHEKLNKIYPIINCSIPKKYRTTSGFCEHCKYDRVKKTTYLLKYEDDYLQVSRSCIPEVTKSIAVSQIANICALIKDLFEEEDYFLGKKSILKKHAYYEVKNILNYAVESVKNNGYIKKFENMERNNNSTYNSVVNMIEFNLKCNNYKKVNSMINWAKCYDGSNCFIKNIKSIINENYVSTENIGVLSSFVSIYNNETKKNTSDFYGRPGQNISIDITNGEFVGQYMSPVGKIYVYKFINKKGYVFVSKSVKVISNVNLITHLDGTIVSHDVYKNERQTVLDNVKIKTSC